MDATPSRHCLRSRSKHPGFRFSFEFSVLIDSALDAVIDSVIFRERFAFANRVLGAGVEPAHLAALEPKSGVCYYAARAKR